MYKLTWIDTKQCFVCDVTAATLVFQIKGILITCNGHILFFRNSNVTAVLFAFYSPGVTRVILSRF